MAKGREIKLPLPAADDLFSTQEERDEAKREFIADIPLTEISDLLWSSIFVTLVAKKYRFMQFELDMVFDTH